MRLVSASTSLFNFCLDDLSVGESGVVKSLTLTVLGPMCDFNWDQQTHLIQVNSVVECFIGNSCRVSDAILLLNSKRILCFALLCFI